MSKFYTPTTAELSVRLTETLSPGTANEKPAGAIHVCSDLNVFRGFIKRVGVPAYQEELDILKDPLLFERITRGELNKKVVGEIESIQAIFLTMTGILVINHHTASYNLRVDSNSGAGKDLITWATSELFHNGEPRDAELGVVRRTRISPKVFNYWHVSKTDPTWTWYGKVCYLSDVSQEVLDSDVFKLMCSEGSSVTITLEGRAVDLEVKGKPVMIITTASVNSGNEMLRRFPILSLDESKEQTEGIMNRTAQYAEEGRGVEYDPKIKGALRLLERVRVKIPFAKKLVKHFPSDHVIMRTHFNRLLDLIKASAALHQYQRQRDKEGYLIAEGLDYDIARIAIIKTTSNRLMIPLSQKQKRFLKVIKDEFGSEEFKVSALLEYIKFLHQSNIYEYLDKLSEHFFDVRIREPGEVGYGSITKPTRFYRLIYQEATEIPTWDIIDKDCGKIGNTGNTINTGNKGITGNTIIDEIKASHSIAIPVIPKEHNNSLEDRQRPHENSNSCNSCKIYEPPLSQKAEEITEKSQKPRDFKSFILKNIKENDEGEGVELAEIICLGVVDYDLTKKEALKILKEHVDRGVIFENSKDRFRLARD